MRTLEEILAVLPVDRRDEIEALALVIRREVQAAIEAGRDRPPTMNEMARAAMLDVLHAQRRAVPRGQWTRCVEGVPCNVCNCGFGNS